MKDTDRPNRQSNMEKAEGDRAAAPRHEEQGNAGMTNRPIEEEEEERDHHRRVPDRADRKGGTHAR